MTITAEQILEDACLKYRELCQSLLPNRASDWPAICREKSEVNLANGIVVLRSSEGRYLRSYRYRYEYAMWEPELCRECRKPLVECYMAKEDLWRQAGYGPLDLVCPRCLGKKLGRRLRPSDFDRRHPWVSRHIGPLPGLKAGSRFLRDLFRASRQQILCADRLLAWHHAGRRRLGRKLVAPYAGCKFLDYSCGDGTFLALVHDLFPVAVGADTDPQRIADCAQRFPQRNGLSFVLRNELAEKRHAKTYGLVVCLELLEHCLEESWDAVLSDLSQLTAPEGTVIISTPIEIGASLIGKQIGRTVAGWRGLGSYQDRDRYTMAQLWKMVFAGERTTIDRPVHRAESLSAQGPLFHSHIGFNWRKLRAHVRQRFIVERTCFSPLSWSGGYFSSQVWFVCKQR